MITVEWLGGMRDGEQVSLPQDALWVEYMMPLDNSAIPREGQDPTEHPRTTKVRVPVKIREDGRAFLVWAERSPK